MPWPATNGPGRTDRTNTRAAGILREGGVHPRKLGHVVIGSTDEESSTKFFTEGLGFELSDRVPFLAAAPPRCSRRTRAGTSGVSAGTTSGRTSSGT
ncbi:VOC family protein [Lapillicoccus sp.]|uniref:VOC family protein n=1 Tax=Lapillicoccus sp. TaxID=1909287 RepID=UPI003263DB00